jgi:hypothetical protein
LLFSRPLTTRNRADIFGLTAKLEFGHFQAT